MLQISLQDRTRTEFRVGDACWLDADLKEFGCVLAANLICRLQDPLMFLVRCASLVARGGILVITSPYTFMTEYTPEVHEIYFNQISINYNTL